MARKDTPLILQRKRSLVTDAIVGRASASSTGLSRSFGLPVEDVQRILRNARIQDDG